MVVIAAVVLAGGRARRLGSVDKLALVVGGVPLLDRVLAAARPGCGPIVVVGPPRPTRVAGVTFTQEAEPGGGPVPAVAAGLAALGEGDAPSTPPSAVLVLAGDLPGLTPAVVAAVVQPVVDGAPAAAAAGDDGRPVPLLATYRPAVLVAALAALGPNQRDVPAHRLLPPTAVLVTVPPAALTNVNTPDDLAAARARHA